MTLQIRVALVIASIIVAYYMIHSIRQSRLVIGDALYWFLFALLILLLAIFPQILYWLSSVFGFVSASNLVFLIIVGLLLLRLFQMEMRIHQFSNRIERLDEELKEKE